MGLQPEHSLSPSDRWTDSERANQTFEQVIRQFIAPDMTNWDTLLPMVEFAMNDHIHMGMQQTPFFLNLGRHPAKPVDLALDGRDKQAKLTAAELTAAWKKARQLLLDVNSRMMQRENKKRRDHHFLEGDMVYLSSKNLSWKHGTKKMCPRWMGPFKVLEVKGPVTYKLQLPEEWKIHNVFHSSLLKPVPEGTRYHFPEPAHSPHYAP